MTTFRDLGLRAEFVDALAAQGIDDPFAIQEATIADALAGRDVCGKARTGSGKTLAFGLPMLQTVATAKPGHPTALVLVPTRELAKQVVDVLSPLGKTIGTRVAAFYGGASLDKQVRNLSKRIEIAVATPGRMIDLLERGELDLDQVGILVIDEADRMADMGFLPQVEWILRKVPNDRQTLLFSATLDREVDVLVRRYMRDPVRHEVEADTESIDDMTHRFLRVHELDRIKVLAAIADGVSRTMVFVRTKRGADRLVSQLKREGVDAGAIHGDLRQSAREKALKDFQGGSHVVLVATDVAPAASTSTTSTWSCTSTRPRSTRATCTARVAPPGRDRGRRRDARDVGPGARRRAAPAPARVAPADHRGVLERPAPRGSHHARLARTQAQSRDRVVGDVGPDRS